MHYCQAAGRTQQRHEGLVAPLSRGALTVAEFNTRIGLANTRLVPGRSCPEIPPSARVRALVGLAGWPGQVACAMDYLLVAKPPGDA